MPASQRWWVVTACALIMMVEGFDLLIYSNAIPSLLMDRGMALDKAAAGTVGSMIFLGMLLGGLFAGRATQALGLARLLAYGFAGFTLGTALAAFAQSGWQLGLLRGFAGLGLGLVLPAGLSLARKHAGQQYGALAISIVMGGVPLGGMLAAVVSHAIIPSFGWRPLFLAGGVLGLLVLAVVGPYLARVERNAVAEDAQAGEQAGQTGQVRLGNWRDILRGAGLAVLVIGTLATLADLLAWYGVSVWLTQLMREFDVPFTGAMQMMFTLNIGAIVGGLLAASIATRLGARPVAIACGVIAAACLAMIASRSLSGGSLFAVIALLGMSAISAQNLVNTLVADAYPASHRAAAMGVTLGMGRLGAVIAPALGGYILASSWGPSWVLLAFAASALVGATVLLVFTPALSRRSVEQLESSTR